MARERATQGCAARGAAASGAFAEGIPADSTGQELSIPPEQPGFSIGSIGIYIVIDKRCFCDPGYLLYCLLRLTSSQDGQHSRHHIQSHVPSTRPDPLRHPRYCRNRLQPRLRHPVRRGDGRRAGGLRGRPGDRIGRGLGRHRDLHRSLAEGQVPGARRQHARHGLVGRPGRQRQQADRH